MLKSTGLWTSDNALQPFCVWVNVDKAGILLEIQSQADQDLSAVDLRRDMRTTIVDNSINRNSNAAVSNSAGDSFTNWTADGLIDHSEVPPIEQASRTSYEKSYSF